MKRIFTQLTLAITLSAASSESALAGDHHLSSTAMPLAAVLESLEKQGFQSVKKIEYENGSYVIKGVNAEGLHVKFHANPTTGAVIASEHFPTANKVSMKEAVKIVEAAGYKDIYKVELENNSYEVEAFDKDGKKVEFEIDGTTGKMTKD